MSGIISVPSHRLHPLFYLGGREIYTTKIPISSAINHAVIKSRHVKFKLAEMGTDHNLVVDRRDFALPNPGNKPAGKLAHGHRQDLST